MRLRKLTKMQTINDGSRSLIESIMSPEVIVALRDWVRSTKSAAARQAAGAVIGGLGYRITVSHDSLRISTSCFCFYSLPTSRITFGVSPALRRANFGTIGPRSKCCCHPVIDQCSPGDCRARHSHRNSLERHPRSDRICIGRAKAWTATSSA
jgi:hypothetical protein